MVYTAEEVQKLLQAEADRRVNQALAKQKKDYEKKLSLSSLDEQQRKEKEAQMRIEELQEQLASFQIEKNRSELKSVLSSRGLSAEFADIINVGEDENPLFTKASLSFYGVKCNAVSEFVSEIIPKH